MIKWKTEKLGNLVKFSSGGTPSKMRQEYWNGDIPWISAKTMKTERISSSELFITQEGLNRGSKLAPKGSLLLLTRGSGLFNGIPICYVEKPVAYNQDIKCIESVSEIENEFIYYWLKAQSDTLQKQLDVTGIGAGKFDTKFLQNLLVSYPDWLTRKKIIAFANNITGKVCINNAINENLADQIQAIYSNEFDPTTHRPSGVLAEICSYSSDRILVSELSVSTYFSTENMQPNKMGSIDATSLPSITQTTGCHKGDVLISNIRPYFKKIVYVTDDNCGCSTDVLCFVPKEDQYSAFLFGTLYMDRFFDYMVAGSKGTKMPRGDKQQIMNYPVVLPDKKSLDLFNELIVPMLDKIATNRIENSRLAALRDALLPKLMSGELDVSELDL